MTQPQPSVRAVAVIPARYASERLPGKPLALLSEKPLIQWVYESAAAALGSERVLVATDDERIKEAVEDFGGRAVMTSAECPSGSDRVAEALLVVSETDEIWRDAEVIINLQGDELFVEASMLNDLVACFEKPETRMATLRKAIATDIDSPGQAEDPNLVKVVCDHSGRALYFSRAPIPYLRDREVKTVLWGHVGIYAYRRDTLLEFVSWPPTELEQAERLEQLRALEHGVPIETVITSVETLGVDTEDDLRRAEVRLTKH